MRSYRIDPLRNLNGKKIALGLAVIFALMFLMTYFSNRLRAAGPQALPAEIGQEGDGQASDQEETAAAEIHLPEGHSENADVSPPLEKEEVGVNDAAKEMGESGLSGEEVLPAEKTGEEPSSDGSGLFSQGENASVDLKASFIRLILSLAAVTALIFTTRFFLRRAGNRKNLPEGHMKTIAYMRLGNGRGVHEVQVGDRIWFIGESERGLHLLGEFTRHELEVLEGEDLDGTDSDFQRLLKEGLELGNEEYPLRERGWLDALRWRTARK